MKLASPIVALVLLASTLVSLPSCGGGPTAPVPMAEVRGGLLRIFVECTNPAGCDWPGQATNLGPGCARDVRGTITLEGSLGFSLTFNWALQPTRVLRPNEMVDFTMYRTEFGTTVPANGSVSRTFWSNVPC